MFNEELKRAFAEKHGKSEKTRKTLFNIFAFTEPLETKHGDICTWGISDFEEFFETRSYTSAGTASTERSILLRYCRFCRESGFEGARDTWETVPQATISADGIKDKFVKSPSELDEYLTESFAPEISSELRVLAVKAYYWLAFSGVPEQEVTLVTPKTIHKDTITIRSGVYYIPNEAGYIITSLCDSIPPDKPLIKAYSEKASQNNMKGYIANVLNPESRRLRYREVYKSGLFCRIYEQEKQGFPVRFDEEIERQIATTGYNGYGRSLQSRKDRLRSTLLKDYNAWKTAFGL